MNQTWYIYYNQGPDFDDMSSFFSCEIDDAIQYINLGYGAQAPKIGKISYGCTFVDRNKYVLYCHTVK